MKDVQYRVGSSEDFQGHYWRVLFVTFLTNLQLYTLSKKLRGIKFSSIICNVDDNWTPTFYNIFCWGLANSYGNWLVI